jgi:hypothetical protein
MTVRVYSHTDAGAPLLSGTVGSLIGVLDACLVNGYGSKAAAGWTKPFSGTNKAAYLPGGILPSKVYLRVDDAGALTAEDSRMRGYSILVDVDTGSEEFPTVAQRANGLFFKKSSTADAVARPWIVVADERTFYIVSGYSSSVIGVAKLSAQSGFFGFGDFDCIDPDEPGNQFISGRLTEDSVAESQDIIGTNVTYVGILPSAYTYTKKSHVYYNELSKPSTVVWNYSAASSTLNGLLPSSVDGNFYLSKGHIMQQETSDWSISGIVGTMRGLYQQCRVQDSDTFALNHGRVISDGTKDYLFFVGWTGYHFAFEISDTW